MDILRDLAAGNVTEQGWNVRKKRLFLVLSIMDKISPPHPFLLFVTEVEAGKKQLKTSVYMASENGASVIEDMAVQVLLSKKIVDLLTVLIVDCR